MAFSIREDGFESDIPQDIADGTHMRLIKVPDYYDPTEPTEIYQTWNRLKEATPVLANEIMRLCFEIAPSDLSLKKRIREAMVSLYLVLDDARLASGLKSDTEES